MSHIPKYRRTSKGMAFVEHQSIDNKSHRLTLGEFGSPESKKKYRLFLEQLERQKEDCVLELKLSGFDHAICELILSYLNFAKSHYRKDGKKSKEFWFMAAILKRLNKYFGDDLARKFGPRSLIAFQKNLIDEKLARTSINKDISRIKRFFKWCCQNEYLPPEVYHGLICVDGLIRGRTEARETKPIPPVSWSEVEKVFPFVSPTLAAMIQTQWLCGMRPQDVCIMRGCNIDRSNDIWLYDVPKHKNLWRGHNLIKAIPPLAQKVLTPFLDRPEDVYFFRPEESALWNLQQRSTKPAALGRILNDLFDTPAYGKSILKGFKKASKNGVKIDHWTPNQLRHGIATEIAREYGQQAAQLWLGHSSLKTTDIYTERKTADLIQLARLIDQNRD